MKLIQLNAWAGRLEKQINNFLKAEQPEILCLQEVISYENDDSGFFLSLENMQKTTNLPYAVFTPVFSFQFQRKTARFGNAILSKHPIQKSETVFTYLEHKEDFEFQTDSANVRNFIHAVVELNGKPHNIITHHGYHIDGHKNGDSETLRQMKILANYVESLDGPVILTGDFNLAPHSESLEQINSLLTNLAVTHHLKTTRTHLTHKTEVCDYIFVNDEVTVKDFMTSDEIISDHKALIMEFGD